MENVAEGEFKKNVAELRLVAQFIHGVEKTTMLFSSTSAHNINSLPPPILRGQKDDIRVELKVEIQALRKSNFKIEHHLPNSDHLLLHLNEELDINQHKSSSSCCGIRAIQKKKTKYKFTKLCENMYCNIDMLHVLCIDGICTKLICT